MDKGKALDTRFEQIDALNAKIMSLKMQLDTTRKQAIKALNEGKEQLAIDLNKLIESITNQIEDYTAIIKNINKEIRNNWRQPEEKETKTTDEEPEEKKIVETPEIRWYNFIQRFKRWRDNRNQKLLGEGQVSETQIQEKPTLRNRIRVANGDISKTYPSTQQGMKQPFNRGNVDQKSIDEPGDEPGDEMDL